MKRLLIFSTVLTAFALSLTSNAQTSEIVAKGDFIEKQKSISGGWTIIKDGADRYLELGDDFKSKSGPDLKIFISPATLSEVTGKTATKGSVLVAELKNIKGYQRYPIPSDIDLTHFRSLLVHCERYAILWGGGSL